MRIDLISELYLDCPVCGRPGPAETPPCVDGHGEECPDRICARCGTALFVDPYITINGCLADFDADGADAGALADGAA